MKKIKFILTLILVLILNNSIAQSNEKNREYCKNRLEKKNDVKELVSEFTISSLSKIQKELLAQKLYKYSPSIYKIVMRGDILTIYHISDTQYHFYKEFLINEGVYINFISSNELRESQLN